MVGVNSGGVGDVVLRSRWRRALWGVVGITAAGVLLAALGLALGGPAPLAGAGALFLGLGLAALRSATAEVRADARGIHTRGRTTPWPDVADLRVRVKTWPRGEESRHVLVAPPQGPARQLPLPVGWGGADQDFDTGLEALRALHRRHGNPESDHLVVVSRRTAGRGSVWSPVLCVLLLAGAGLTAWFVPRADADRRAWEAAVPCAAATPAEDRRECLTRIPAVIERTDDDGPKRGGVLYFADDRPVDRLRVSQEAVQEFGPGDEVELTAWRGEVREIAGSRYVWREHVAPPGDLAAVSAGLALAAGYPAARMLTRRRGRRLPDGEVLPSALPFAAVLAGTGAWLLPLCHRHPTTLLDSPTTIIWAVAGTAASLGMAALAWRATRVRPPGDTDAPAEQGEVFVRAHFLESTDYNPHGFGTHIALGGDEPPAVTPGPDRFAARTVPARRLTVRQVRRARGTDGDLVPRSWHIAELDDAGTPVRLAAAPADLTRVLRALAAAGTLEDASTPGSDR
ncbi:PH domain-containing protein [Streptomyces cinnabarinus]|uniref:PH domain-containing protein n=1 Tax=Streptomyces cinnabarinus TaxID=67287 RepID=A0ABY7KJW5_9ACTN|nr:PH domain-containing protein [Streptomyces cinnabarinus]WAZ23697.1 PH domain-containing protein [Streptomyces cinnabarinus]